MKPECLNSAAVQVQMFGGFSITIGGITVSEGDSLSKKAWLLLQYLIAFQKREISTSELVNILWPDTELSSPSGSLKSLVFRARKLLAPLPIPASELLIQQNGVYRWNPSVSTEIDSQQFDTLCSQIFMEQDIKEQIALCLKAMELYRGEFLPNSSEESWVIPINTYYASLFLKVAHLCMELYMQEENYSQQIALCRRVLALSPYDETAHYNLIYSLYLSGNQIAAVNHYQAVINNFYNHPGEFPPLSDTFTALYKIISSENHAQASDIEEILSQLSENTPPQVSKRSLLLRVRCVQGSVPRYYTKHIKSRRLRLPLPALPHCAGSEIHPIPDTFQGYGFSLPGHYHNPEKGRCILPLQLRAVPAASACR